MTRESKDVATARTFTSSNVIWCEVRVDNLGRQHYMCSNDKQGSECEDQLDDNFLIGSPILPLGPRPIIAYLTLPPNATGRQHWKLIGLSPKGQFPAQLLYKGIVPRKSGRLQISLILLFNFQIWHQPKPYRAFPSLDSSTEPQRTLKRTLHFSTILSTTPQSKH